MSKAEQSNFDFGKAPEPKGDGIPEEIRKKFKYYRILRERREEEARRIKGGQTKREQDGDPQL